MCAVARTALVQYIKTRLKIEMDKKKAKIAVLVDSVL